MLSRKNMQKHVCPLNVKSDRFHERKRNMVAFAAVIVIAVLHAILPVFKAQITLAEPGKGDITIELTKDACWYEIGTRGKIFITLRNRTRERIKGVTFRVRSHRRTVSRSSIREFFEEKETGPVRAVEYQKAELTLLPGANKFTAEIEFNKEKFSRGIYPVTVEVLRKNRKEAEARTLFLVMSGDEMEQYPALNVITIIAIHPFPYYDPDGNLSAKRIIDACLSNGNRRGWLYALVKGIIQYPEIRPSVSFAPYLMEEIEEVSKSVRKEETRRSSKTGTSVENSESTLKVLDNIRFLASSGTAQFLLTPYALPNLEIQWNIGWQKDAKEQISLGADTLERCLGIMPDKRFLFPPAMSINSNVAGDLEAGTCDVAVLSTGLRDRSKKLSSIIDANSPLVPFSLKTKSNKEITCFFADRLASELINKASKSSDAHAAAQMIAADLATLFLQNPAKERTCTLVWSIPKQPSPAAISRLIEVLSNAPWLNNLTLSEASALYETKHLESIEIPLKRSAEELSYFPEVGVAREAFWKFRKAVPPNNQLVSHLRRNLFIAQSDIWRQSNARTRGLDYAGYINRRIREEAAKISFEQTGMITLTGGKTRIPLTVRNLTGYRVKALLELSCEGISFPHGNRAKITLEPKENLFEVPVTVIRKGKLTLRAVINSDGLELSRTEIIIHTGRYSIFAIVLLGTILLAIALLSAIRVIARRRVGKHKSKKRKKTSED